MEVNSVQQQFNFKGRCLAIKDAQWVANTVNSAIPHTSITRQSDMYIKYVDKHKDLIVDYKKPEDLNEVYELLRGNLMTPLDLFRRKDYDKKALSLLEYIKELIVKVKNERAVEKKNHPVIASLHMVENNKHGNCGEKAFLSDLILRMNGVKNVSFGVLQRHNTGYVDHQVCLVSSDGKLVDIDSFADKAKRKKIIVIDPWLGVADFYNNILKRYKAQSLHLGISEKEKISIAPIQYKSLSPEMIERKKTEYSMFIFPNKHRKLFES